jgi:hypothetical protein
MNQRIGFFKLVVMALVVAVCGRSALAAPKPTSEFTSTDTKKYRLASRGENSGTAVCPGLGGYKILYSIGDDRSWIDLQYAGQEVNLSGETFEHCKGARPWKANDVVQWRGFRKGNQFVPHAIIFRMKSENPNPKQKPYETLVVVKLDGLNSRVVGHAAGNLEAEAIADREGLSVGSGGAIRQAEDVPPVVGVPQQGAAASDSRPVEVVHTDAGIRVVFPNGQFFNLASERGLLGPSTDPSDQRPFEIEDGWLVALNEQPATKTSFAHLYLRDGKGKWTELPNVQQRILKIAGGGRTRLNSDFVRVEHAQSDGPSSALLQIEYFKGNDPEPMHVPIAVSKTGNLTFGMRGE